jgi:2-oxoglutarate ferredoxin oxidoreductase subunit beta
MRKGEDEVSPCPTLYQRRNKMDDSLDAMRYYKKATKIRNGAPSCECGPTKDAEIIVGKFVDRDRPDFFEWLRSQMVESLAER